MMHSAETIEGWLKVIIGHEGGYVNNPSDPGGETKWGISKRAYPHLNIPSLTVDDAIDIYITDYLLPLRADLMGPKLAFQMFDLAINSGVRRAVMALQSVLNVQADGVLGPKTESALRLHAASLGADVRLAVNLIAARQDFLTQLDGWPVFGKGWSRRLADNMRHAAE